MKNRDIINEMSTTELAKLLSIIAKYGTDFKIEEICGIYHSAYDEFDYEYLSEYEQWLDKEIQEMD